MYETNQSYKEVPVKSRSWSVPLLVVLFLIPLLQFACERDNDRGRETETPRSAREDSAVSATPGSIAALADRANGSVVNISATKISERSPWPFKDFFGKDNPFEDFFDRFFGDQMPKKFKQRGLGSGFIIDKDGYILTNNHVVEKTDEIKVILADESEFDATIVGRDPKTDLALIRIQTDKDLVPLALGNSDKLRVGDWVVAIGNPFGLGNTVTAGIVSAKYRRIGAGAYDDFIQTDASINPGNSGGPLLNLAGEVVGINTAIFSQSGGNIGIGFAIPVNMAKDLIPQLRKGKVVRGWLGVMIQKITPELQEKLDLEDDQGALVADVTEGGPAEEAGIRRGDVIVSFDGQPIEEMDDLPYIVATTPVGKKVDVEIIRDGRKKTLEVKVGEMVEEGAPVAVSEAEPELGMVVKKITPELARSLNLPQDEGLVITEVEQNSPAAEAGLRPGDMILEMDQSSVKELDDFNKKMEDYKPGDTVLFLIQRGGNTLYLTLKVEE
jgi:serine protease Do